MVSLPPQASVWDAACVMTKANCGSVLIIDGAGVMLGILTERDLVTRVLTNAMNASVGPSFVTLSTMRWVSNCRHCSLLAAAFVQLPLGAGPSQRRFDHHAFLVKYGEVGVL